MVENQLLWFFGLGAWAFATVMAIKPLHSYMMSKGCENMVAVYYNRKVAHMVAGGVPLIMCPIVFTDPIYPLLGGVLIVQANKLVYAEPNKNRVAKKKRLFVSVKGQSAYSVEE